MLVFLFFLKFSNTKEINDPEAYNITKKMVTSSIKPSQLLTASIVNRYRYSLVYLYSYRPKEFPYSCYHTLRRYIKTIIIIVIITIIKCTASTVLLSTFLIFIQSKFMTGNLR